MLEFYSFRWHIGLNKKTIAYVSLAKNDTDLKLMHGDELRLRYLGECHKPWTGKYQFFGIHLNNSL